MVKNKYYIMFVAVLAWIFLLSWSFNHMNPWIAFVIGFVALYFLNNYINEKRKKDENS